MLKSKKIAPRKKVDLELLHHVLGKISTRLLMARDAAIFGRIFNLGYIQTLFAHHARFI